MNEKMQIKQAKQAIAAHKQSPPVDLGADIDSIKTRFRLADPDTEFRQDSLMKALDEAFRAGQSDNADTARLNWLESKMPLVSVWNGDKFVALYSNTMGNFNSLREAIDVAIAQTQNTQGGNL